jgi:uncharacterized protein
VKARVKAGVEDALGKGGAALARKDYAEAMLWYRVAADQGDGAAQAAAQAAIGTLYEQGLGVPRNPELAGQWFSKAAAHSDRRAK